ncbi:prepilin-type N-terminal cleavage/methylation domain-containing protein [Orbus mooreae]|uniref:prepilin-type N-terminal cleavage/methylation domain-containing protein n=1 Tax=Orbus mooreae TaxID=3074107 RepID=UPI00370D86D4
MNSSAFSLLELLIVIAICSILATIGLASWRDLQDRNELSVVTLGVLQFLNEVKLVANHYNHNQSVYFVKKSHQEWCIVASEADLSASDCEYRLRFVVQNKHVELTGLSTNAQLIFYGRRNTAKAVTIKLKNRVGESRIIISVPGRIRYCSYQTYLSGFTPC